jgi:hypothetical protein
MSDLTDQLDAIQARVDAATPGPWAMDEREQTVRVEDGGGCPWGGEIMYDRSGYGRKEWAKDFRSDAVFIANAPTDIEFMVVLARKQQAAIDGVKAELADAPPANYEEDNYDAGYVAGLVYALEALEAKP